MLKQSKFSLKEEFKFCALIFIILSSLIYPQQKFRTGVYSQLSPELANKQNLKQVNEMGPNMVINQVTNSNKDSLQTLFDKVIAINAYKQTDYIYHYSSGCYTKWEAESSVDINAITPGIKHEFGTNGGTYWYSGTNSGDSGKYLMKGPDYRQDRKYKQYYDTSTIQYIAKFNMKIDGALTPGVPVCEISVGYRTEEGQFAILISKTFNADSLSNSFRNYQLQYTIPETINGSATAKPIVKFDGIAKYSETNQQTSYSGAYGVQFNVKWLGNRNLYVDYIEVYDQYIWGDYLSDPNGARNRILNYAATSGTSNTQYWYSLDEPQSIDNFEPYKIVESILTSNGYPPLITAFYPGWNGYRNNELTMKRFIETVQPQMLMYDYYPYENNLTDEQCLEYQRSLMQQPFNNGFPLVDYYYAAQSYGYTPTCIGDIYFNKRKPSAAELRATVMLALAHGIKGIFFWPYYSYKTDTSACGQQEVVDAIVDTNGTPTNLYYEIKNNIFPRLNGSLGYTLINLKYSVGYIHVSNTNHSVNSNDFLTIADYGSDYNWQTGFLNDKVNSDNKYFFIANLRTDGSRTACLHFTNNTGRANLRIRNIEDPSVDFTINTTYDYYPVLQAGEGNLYQVVR